MTDIADPLPAQEQHAERAANLRQAFLEPLELSRLTKSSPVGSPPEISMSGTQFDVDVDDPQPDLRRHLPDDAGVSGLKRWLTQPRRSGAWQVHLESFPGAIREQNEDNSWSSPSLPLRRSSPATLSAPARCFSIRGVIPLLRGVIPVRQTASNSLVNSCSPSRLVHVNKYRRGRRTCSHRAVPFLYLGCMDRRLGVRTEHV